MKEKLINLYQTSKTLRFSLVPVGTTAQTFEKMMVLEQDEKRAENYEKVKSYIDRYHRWYIDVQLSGKMSDTFISLLHEYIALYRKPDKDTEKCEALEGKLRNEIKVQLQNNPVFKKLKSEKMIKEILPGFLTDETEKSIVGSFARFTTYFSDFFKNRENMYSEKDQVTGIAHRCINDNLPKFIDNCNSFRRVLSTLPADEIDRLNEDMLSVFGIYAADIFTEDYFVMVLPQSGIDVYNGVIGGVVCEDGTKIKGVNEYINLYNQTVSKKSDRLPLMKPLYKQILSESESVSFIPEKFSDDKEVLADINTCYHDCIGTTVQKLKTLFSELESFDPSGIYVQSGLPVTDLSNAVFGNWDTVSLAWNTEYETKFPRKPAMSADVYAEKERKEYKRFKSFSIAELQRLGSRFSDASVIRYYKTETVKRVDAIISAYSDAVCLLSSDYPETGKLSADIVSVERIKDLLDAVKQLEFLLKPLLGTGKEEAKDEVFYGEFIPLYTELTVIDRLYDKTRNYLTQKPYSNDKIKLTFNIPSLLGGWVESIGEKSDNGTQYHGYLFRKSNGIEEYDYYLGISENAKRFRSFFEVEPDDMSEYERLEYYQLKGRTIYGTGYKGEHPYNEDEKRFFELITGFAGKYGDKALIDTVAAYYAKDTANPKGCVNEIARNNPDAYAALMQDAEYQAFNRKLIDALLRTMKGMTRMKAVRSILDREYDSFIDLMDDIKKAENERSFKYHAVSRKEMAAAMIDEKQPLYLFKITNKDLSYADTYLSGQRKSRGTENLHTMYFKSLMSGTQSVFDIGKGEVFYRKKSIEMAAPTHPAGTAIANKNTLNKKRESVFAYDLYKNRRYMFDSFKLHLSMIINYSCPEKYTELDRSVRSALKHKADPYIIGIDRGERNLLYICVINSAGEIVEQTSLNQITGDNGHIVDYHDLLDRKEKERDAARRSWGTVENIKELKEGYLSQAIHKICELVTKYDAVIAMEDLNRGMINSRVKVEKQVYAKFEKMLEEKLNYLVDKKAVRESDGGLYRAYQMTNKAGEQHKGMQNGIIFYIPAWNTSKLDPVTGFVDLLKPKYTNAESAKAFFALFDDIRYDREDDLFEFAFNYAKFPKGITAGDTDWVVCTNGERIRTYRNPEKNNEWDSAVVNLTEGFKALFEEFDIDYSSQLKAKIISADSAEFFKRLTSLLALTLQMRNSITGRTDVDYIISPVRNANGEFFDSRKASAALPADADANGAYNIARKVLWAINVLKNKKDSELDTAKLAITNKDWLYYAMNGSGR